MNGEHADDPMALLGHRVAVHMTEQGDVGVSLPGEPDTVMIWFLGAPTVADASRRATAFVRMDLEGARTVALALGAAIAALEEGADT